MAEGEWDIFSSFEDVEYPKLKSYIAAPYFSVPCIGEGPRNFEMKSDVEDGIRADTSLFKLPTSLARGRLIYYLFIMHQTQIQAGFFCGIKIRDCAFGHEVEFMP